MRYNETVNLYNISVKRFPSNILAKMFDFKKSEDYFKSEQAAQQAPKVQF